MNKKHTLLFFGLLAAGLMVSNAALARDSVNESKKASPKGDVQINVVRGELVIVGWDKNEISVSGKLDEKYKEFIFEVDKDDAIISVKLPNSNGSWCCNEGSDLKINVPKGSKVRVSVVSSEVEVENILGGLDVSGVSGDFKIEKIRDRIRLTNVSGEIDVRDIEGRVRIRSVSGDIEAQNVRGVQKYHSISGNVLLRDVSDELDLESVSGELELVNGVVSQVRGHSVSGSVDLEVELLDKASVEFGSMSGTIRLRLSGDLGARFDLQTSSGSIRNRVTSDRPKPSKYIRDETLKFVVGDGEGEVIISTHSGDIVLTSK